MSNSNMYLVGSPEWFREKATLKANIEFGIEIEEFRNNFIERFSPERLKEMSGKDLLVEVFGNDNNSMMQLLMFCEDYKQFGSIGTYKYNGIVYYAENEWRFKIGVHPDPLTYEEAVKKAEFVRDQLLICTNAIEGTNLDTIDGYKELSEKISTVFFNHYAWTLKYYQMVYPYYFPGMYAPHTVNAALKLLGLQTYPRIILGMGELSLFIRKCDINNIVFGNIYGNEWKWKEDLPPCPAAKDNFIQRHLTGIVNTSHYRLPRGESENDKKKRIAVAVAIEKEVDQRHLVGEERKAYVSIRVNQDEFRDRLIKRYGKCCLCNVSNPKLLIASHIKPWTDGTPEERLDTDNGLLLCPNHDKLFDQGYVSFDSNGKIAISDEISDNDRIFMNIRNDVEITLNSGNKKYMAYHYENIFKK